jgi:hypothetical protein
VIGDRCLDGREDEPERHCQDQSPHHLWAHPAGTSYQGGLHPTSIRSIADKLTW